LKYAWLKALSTRFLYEGFVGACALFGTSPDKVIQGTVRGFQGRRVLPEIRHRPCGAAARRASRVGSPRQRTSRRRAHGALGAPDRTRGRPLEVPGLDGAVQELLGVHRALESARGTGRALVGARLRPTQAATLSALPAPASHPHAEPREARAMLARLVYVPVYAEMPESKMDEIASIVRSMPALSTESKRKKSRGRSWPESRAETERYGARLDSAVSSPRAPS
jgi:hypothetical protein